MPSDFFQSPKVALGSFLIIPCRFAIEVGSFMESQKFFQCLRFSRLIFFERECFAAKYALLLAGEGEDLLSFHNLLTSLCREFSSLVHQRASLGLSRVVNELLKRASFIDLVKAKASVSMVRGVHRIGYNNNL